MCVLILIFIVTFAVIKITMVIQTICQIISVPQSMKTVVPVL